MKLRIESMVLTADQTQQKKRLMNWKLQYSENVQTKTQRKKNGNYKRVSEVYKTNWKGLTCVIEIPKEKEEKAEGRSNI